MSETIDRVSEAETKKFACFTVTFHNTPDHIWRDEEKQAVMDGATNASKHIQPTIHW